MLDELTRPSDIASFQQRAGFERLGERLVRQGLITPVQLEQALDVQGRNGAFLGQIVADLGFVPSAKIGAMLARDFGVPYGDLISNRPEPTAVALAPEHL